MKAILLGPAHPIKGGIANFNESLAIAFIKNSIETEIVSYYYLYPSLFSPNKTLKAEGKAPFSLKIKTIVNSFNPFSWIKSARFIAHESPDIVIVQYWLPFMAPALGSILRLLNKKHVPKIISIIHNVKPQNERFYNVAFTRYFLNSCNGFICLSKSQLNDLEVFTTNPNKVFVPHPVYDIFGDKIEKSEARKFLGINDDDRVLLFFGIIKKYKGLELLLNSMATEKVRKLKVKLIVAGEFFEERSHILSLVNKLNLKDNIIFSNKFIPTDNVKYYFCSADIIVQPYIDITQSGVTQIAYNFERPMIVTNVGGLADIVFDKHTGYVTNVNADSIADAIVDFYDNNREDVMSANVALEQYRFSWHAMVDAILNLSENIK